MYAAIGEVLAAVEEIGAALGGAEGEAETFGSVALKNFEKVKQVAEVVKDAVEGVAKAFNDVIKPMLDLAIASSDAHTQLEIAANTARNLGQSFDTDKMEHWLETLSRSAKGGGFALKELRDSFEQLTAAGAKPGEAQRLVALAAGMASMKHESLDQATKNLASGISGNVDAVANYGADVKDAHNRPLGADAVVSRLEGAVKGDAEIHANSLNAALTRLNSTASDMLEGAFGKPLEAVFTALANAATHVLDWIGKIPGALGSIASAVSGALSNVGSFLASLATSIGGYFGRLASTIAGVLSSAFGWVETEVGRLMKGFAGMFGGLITGFGDAASSIIRSAGGIIGIISGIVAAVQEIIWAVQQVINAFTHLGDHIGAILTWAKEAFSKFATGVSSEFDGLREIAVGFVDKALHRPGADQKIEEGKQKALAPWQQAGSFVSSLPAGALAAAENVWAKAQSDFEARHRAAVPAVTAGVQAAESTAISIANTVKADASRAANAVAGFAKNIESGLESGARAAVSSLRSVQGAVDKALDAAAKAIVDNTVGTTADQTATIPRDRVRGHNQGVSSSPDGSSSTVTNHVANSTNNNTTNYVTNTTNDNRTTNVTRAPKPAKIKPRKAPKKSPGPLAPPPAWTPTGQRGRGPLLQPRADGDRDYLGGSDSGGSGTSGGSSATTTPAVSALTRFIDALVQKLNVPGLKAKPEVNGQPTGFTFSWQEFLLQAATKTKSFGDIMNVVNQIMGIFVQIFDAFRPIIDLLLKGIGFVANGFVDLWNAIARILRIFGIHVELLQKVNTNFSQLSANTAPLIAVTHDIPTLNELASGKIAALSPTSNAYSDLSQAQQPTIDALKDPGLGGGILGVLGSILEGILALKLVSGLFGGGGFLGGLFGGSGGGLFGSVLKLFGLGGSKSLTPSALAAATGADPVELGGGGELLDTAGGGAGLFGSGTLATTLSTYAAGIVGALGLGDLAAKLTGGNTTNGALGGLLGAGGMFAAMGGSAGLAFLGPIGWGLLAGGALLGGGLGGLFGPKLNAQNNPDIFSTSSIGQGLADFSNSGYNGAPVYTANGQQFTENAQMYQQLGGKGEGAFLGQWIAQNADLAKQLLTPQELAAFTGQNGGIAYKAGGNVQLSNGVTEYWSDLVSQTQDAMQKITQSMQSGLGAVAQTAGNIADHAQAVSQSVSDAGNQLAQINAGSANGVCGQMGTIASLLGEITRGPTAQPVTISQNITHSGDITGPADVNEMAEWHAAATERAMRSRGYLMDRVA